MPLKKTRLFLAGQIQRQRTVNERQRDNEAITAQTSPVCKTCNMISRSLTARVLAAPERILLIETEVDSHASITAYVKEEEWQNNS